MILKEGQKMSCPEGQYFCNDRQKCMPIPKGSKVRKDGELVSEVAPPGFGHTKGDKEKGVKKGGTAAAFDRARKEGRFKGSKSDMFAIMWSQKKKGAKPHYKPGTDKKYKKYEEDWKPEIEHSKLGDAVKKKAEKKRKAAADSLPPHLKLDAMKKAFAHTNEEVAMPHVSSKDKKAMAKRAKNLFTKDEEGTKPGVNEQTSMKDNNLFGDAYAGSYEKLKKKIGSKKMHKKPAIEENKFVKAMVDAVKKKKEEKKPEKAQDAGAKARRMLKRREHAKYVSGSEDNVPDDLRDHKTWNDFNNQLNEGKKKGLWDNIHAKRKRGEKPAKPGDKDYPKTLNIEHHEKDKDGNTIPHKTLNVNEGAAWTKKSGKNPKGGLNEKGRKSYERENPGSDLKAPSKKPGNKRRASFCARMKGMKRKLTSAKTARDPDSRINKSLRAWNC